MRNGGRTRICESARYSVMESSRPQEQESPRTGRYGGLGHHDELGLAMLAAGAVLGMRAGQVAQFYETAVTFLTRVVGCKYLDRPDRLEDIGVGDRVALTQEPFHANVIKVTTLKGQTLGYIRRTIARKLVARIERGASLQGKVALVLGDRFGPNEGCTSR